jgi:nucleoside-diphosphate-sugar epimerase
MSSVGVVGKTDHRVVDESTPCNPTNQYEASKYAAEKIVSQGFDGCSVVILRPTNIFGVDSVRRLSSNSLRSKMGVLLKGNENAHLVYVKDVAAAALYFFQASSANPVEKYIVSSDEEIGNTHREVQAFLSSRIQTAPQPFAVSAPLLIPYYLRRMKHGKTNRGDLVYSSRKISAAGFRFQYGLQRGLCDAVNSILQPPFCR